MLPVDKFKMAPPAAVVVLFVTLSVLYQYMDAQQHTGLSMTSNYNGTFKNGTCKDSRGQNYNLQVSYPLVCKAKNRKKRLPSAILIGERKSGTTCTIKYLASVNSRIKIPDREPHFFANIKHNVISKEDLLQYKKLLPLSCPTDLVFEKTPKYFRTPGVAKRIFSWNRNVKLLLALRDPINRALSDYHYEVRRIENGLKATDAIAYDKYTFEELAINSRTGKPNPMFPPLRRSMYSLQLTKWLRYFPLSSFHVIDSDFFSQNPVAELRKIEAYLGLEPQARENMFYYNRTKGFYCLCGLKCPSTLGHQFPPLDNKVTEMLIQMFRPYVSSLLKLIGQRLSWMERYLT